MAPSSSTSSVSNNPFDDYSDANPFGAAPPPPPKASLSQVQGVHIRNHVPEVLDFDAGNFTSLLTFFHITFRMYGLQEHINGSLAVPLFIPDAEWSQIDQCIVSWLYTSVSKAIRDIILQPADTAARAWTAIVNLFLNNHLQRAVNAKDEFHTLHQGDLSITDFASKIKCLADTLRDVGSPVSDHDMLLALLNALTATASAT
jgi:hypothetical protein